MIAYIKKNIQIIFYCHASFLIASETSRLQNVCENWNHKKHFRFDMRVDEKAPHWCSCNVTRRRRKRLWFSLSGLHACDYILHATTNISLSACCHRLFPAKSYIFCPKIESNSSFCEKIKVVEYIQSIRKRGRLSCWHAKVVRCDFGAFDLCWIVRSISRWD